jgi:septal ring factor EnvC (AmiA/AmiB activator)
MKVRLHVVPTLAVALAAAALIAVGCGDDDDDTPAYCSNVSDLQQSIDELPESVQLESGALSTLQTDVQDVQSNIDAVVSSAKQDFPSETSALESSVSSLSATIEKLPPSPTPQQLLSLAPEIDNVVTSAEDLSSATSSACD